MFIRPFPLTQQRVSSHLATLTSLVNNHQLYGGKGIQIVHQPNGITIKNTLVPRKDTICYRGLYDFNAEYWPYDAIYIDNTLTYLDQSGSALILTSGFYICNQYIPPAGNDNVYFMLSIVPAFASAGGTPTDNDANAYRWYSLNTYYPTTTYSGSQSTVSTGGYNIQSNINFWTFLGGGGEVTWMQFNESASIHKGTLVWVEPNANYASASFTGTPPLCAGAYLCVKDVPQAGPSGSRTPTGNIYYPTYPLWDDNKITHVSGSIYNDKFFEPISPMLVTQQCVNDVWQTVFLCGVISGSLFNNANLPYPV